MKSTTISYAGNQDEVRAFRILANKQNTTVGDLVRKALFAHYGIQIAEVLEDPSFFVNGGTQANHAVSEGAR